MIPEQLQKKIDQCKDLDRRRNRSGVPMDVYRDMSGILADESLVIIDELIGIINKFSKQA